ncbi:hypothetical protein GWK47_054002 [Chionoecetes opilio]|uniref:Uncharacterized protein n=1 Tax=Chionoecetes opilio TaxID=41210 RepID=A0A8J4Y070_CHIOP|nr:hypothetical protein GWK47_054002 [Chionoecetes opilio]
MQKDVSRKIRKYVMKTVCRRNFALLGMPRRRAKGLEAFPGLCLETDDSTVWKSLRQQKAYLNHFLKTEMEAHLYAVSRECQVSCEEIFEAQAAVERLRQKRKFTVKIVNFLDGLPLRRVEYLYDHVFTKMQRDKGEESHCYLDRTSLLLFMETVARRQGQEQLFP